MDQKSLEDIISTALGSDNDARQGSTQEFEVFFQDPNNLDLIIQEIQSPSQEIFRQLILIKLRPYLSQKFDSFSSNIDGLQNLFEALIKYLSEILEADFLNEDNIVHALPSIIFLINNLSIDIFTFPPFIQLVILPEYLSSTSYDNLLSIYSNCIETILVFMGNFAINRSFRRSYYVYCIFSILNAYDLETADSALQNKIVLKLREEIYNPSLKLWNVYLKIWSSLSFAINNGFTPLVNMNLTFFLKVNCDTASLPYFLIPYEYAIVNGQLSIDQIKDKIIYALKSSELIMNDNLYLSIDIFHTIDCILAWIYPKYEQSLFLELFVNYIEEAIELENEMKLSTGIYALSLLISHSPGLINACSDFFMETLTNIMNSESPLQVFTGINCIDMIINSSPQTIVMMSNLISQIFSLFSLNVDEEILTSACELISNVSTHIQYFIGDVTETYPKLDVLLSPDVSTMLFNVMSHVIQSGFYFMKSFSNEMLQFQHEYVQQLINSADIELQSHGAYLASTICEAVPQDTLEYILEINNKVNEMLQSFTQFDQSWSISINYIISMLTTTLEIHREKVQNELVPNIYLSMDICSLEDCPSYVLEYAAEDFIQIRKIISIELTERLQQRIISLISSDQVNNAIVSLVSTYYDQFDQSFVENYIFNLISTYSLEELSQFITNQNVDQVLDMIINILPNIQPEYFDGIIKCLTSICERTNANIDRALSLLIEVSQDLHSGFLSKIVQTVEKAIAYNSCSKEFVSQLAPSILESDSPIFTEDQIRFFAFVGIFYDQELMSISFEKLNPIVSSITEENISKINYFEASAEYQLALLRYGIILDNASILLQQIRFPHYYQNATLNLILSATNTDNNDLTLIAACLLTKYICHSQRNEVSKPITQELNNQIIEKLKILSQNETYSNAMAVEAGQYLQQLKSHLGI